MDLKGKRALVTGGAVRVGRAIAIQLAEAGCDVCVHYGRSHTEATEVVTEIALRGRKGVCLEADLEQPDAPRKLRREVEAVFGPIDILVNNASYWPTPSKMNAEHDLLAESVEHWDHTLAVNARAPFYLIQEFASMLGRDGKGLVLNLLDESISEPYLDRTAHSVSKWALEAVTAIAARALAPSVRVVGIELGAILPNDEMSDADRARRQWGGVEVVTDAVLFAARNQFVSERSSQCAAIAICGGVLGGAAIKFSTRSTPGKQRAGASVVGDSGATLRTDFEFGAELFKGEEDRGAVDAKLLTDILFAGAREIDQVIEERVGLALLNLRQERQKIVALGQEIVEIDNEAKV